MHLPELTIGDILLSVAYAFIFIGLAVIVKKRNPPHPWIRYLVPFVIFKILCAFLFVFIHIYYYKGGDTIVYFKGSKFLAEQIINAPGRSFVYLFGEFKDFSNFKYTNDYQIASFFYDPTTLFVCQLSAPFALLGFQQFLATTLLISVFSAIGIYLLFKTFCKLYPRMHIYFAIGVLFLPSMGIWTSGILKDTYTYFALGLMLFSFYNIIKGKKYLLSVALILFSIYLCLSLKPYILYIFIPAMLIWIQSNISHKLKNPVLKIAFTPFIILVFFAGGYFFLQQISEDAGKYSLENVTETAKGFHLWHTYLSENYDQSGYNLGEVEFNTFGIIEKTPAAFFVTFFRPIPLEIRNIPTAIESVQSMLFLLLTLYILFKVGVFRFFRLLVSDKDIKAFFLFALVFGVAVGFTSYNFGALSRYKIPAVPFFMATLAIIYLKGYLRKRAYKSLKIQPDQQPNRGQ